jgi:hypothetical protein
MDPVTGALIVEGVKLAMQICFTGMKLAGKTDAEIDQLFLEEKAKFDANRPEDLPDV